MLQALRRIIHASDLYSRELAARSKLTAPQIICLRRLRLDGPSHPSDLADRVSLSRATVTGIINRLEDRGYVVRDRGGNDRRRVLVRLTDLGEEIIKDLPLPLHDRLALGLAGLPLIEQEAIANTLALVADMMGPPEKTLTKNRG